MKSVKKVLVLPVLFAAIGIMASCATKSPAEKAAASVEAKQNVEVLEDKGTAFGIKTPTWVAEYLIGGNLAVERIADYKGKNCFVVEGTDADKDYAVTWASNPANGARTVAEKISSTVASTASRNFEGERGEGIESRQKGASETLSNANFSGLSRNGDWWQIVHNKSTDVTETRAFALYTIDQKILNEQVASYLAQFVNRNNEVMSDAERSIYADLIAQIRENGGMNN